MRLAGPRGYSGVVREYLLCLFAAAAVTYLTMPLVRVLAIRCGAMAAVRDRDVHTIPIPRWGGLGMLFGLLAAFLLASKLPMMRSVFETNSTPRAILSGVAVIVALGLIDDRWGLDASVKLLGQTVAAGLMAWQGIQIVWLPIGGTLVLDPLTSMALTTLVILIAINAVNFVDGLDGLAGGIVAIAALAFLMYAYLLSVEFGFTRATLATLLCALLAGMCLGFLPHNIYPARIFMGDTGSMLIGLLLGAAMITLAGRLDPSALQGVTFFPALLPLLLPLAVVAVPLTDVVLAVSRRARAGRSPFAADKQHLHHRLLEMGHSQRRAVNLMYGWTALLAFTAVSMAFMSVAVSATLFIMGTLGMVLLVRHRPAADSGLIAGPGGGVG